MPAQRLQGMQGSAVEASVPREQVAEVSAARVMVFCQIL